MKHGGTTRVFVGRSEIEFVEGWKNFKKKPIIIQAMQMKAAFSVQTLEGEILTGQKGDWLMKGVEGELYPCKNRIFKKTYEGVKK